MSKKLDLYFDLCFQHAATGLPPGVTFDTSKFVRPPRPNQTGLALLTQCAASLEASQPSSCTDLVIHIDHGTHSVTNEASE